MKNLFKIFDRLESGESAALSPDGSAEAVDCPPSAAGPVIGVFSSGSTGRPERVWRAWSGIKAELRVHAGTRGWTWASPFAPWSFAGVQAAAQAWAAGGWFLPLGRDWAENWAVLNCGRVEALSCTPTFLELMLRHIPAHGTQWRPFQVTLGGEVLRPDAGKRFRRAFPKSRFRVVYASAEHGVLLKTPRLDGWYELLALNKRHPDWRIEAGELQLRRGGEWLGTGDLAETRKGLIRVIGRVDNVANVAGTKVNLDEVSRLAEQVSGVRQALASAVPSAVSGQIVLLRFMPEEGMNPDALQERLEEHLRQHLRKEAWPRRWERGEIEAGPNGKRRISRHPAPVLADHEA